MWILILLFIGIVFAFLKMIIDAKQTNNRGALLRTSLSEIDNFKATKTITGIQNRYVFMTDDVSQKVVYSYVLYNQAIKRSFNYSDIISVELLENDSVISEKSVGRTVGGALLGGALFGGAGAIVGGLSGGSKQESLHKTVTVKILVRNTQSPAIEIQCFDYKTMTIDNKPVKDDDDVTYRQGLEDGKTIVDTLSVIIDMLEKASEAKNTDEQSATQSSSLFVADELAKLAVLRDKGILTDVEFADQKARLLDSQKKSDGSNTDSSSLLVG